MLINLRKKRQEQMENGVIDITDLVNSMGVTFEKYAVDFIYLNLIGNAIFAWLAAPGLSYITKEIIKMGVKGFSKSGILIVFFENTALRKAGQAQDYVNAVKKRKFLEGVGTREEFRKAELDEITQFYSLVRVTS